MRFKTLDDFDFKGKRVLVRSDLNSPIVKGKVVMNDRIVESAKTIKELKRKGAKVVVLSHQSRPGNDHFISLKQHARLLNKYVKVKFVSDIVGKKARKEIERMKNGEVILLENVRFLREEFKPSVNNRLVKTFRDFDIYINDSFSVSHREQTSIVSFPRVIPSCVGRLMERELRSLEKIKIKNCLFVLGGSKMKEVVSLFDGRRKILTGGLFGALILLANGQRLGETEKYLKKEKKHYDKLRNPKNVMVPIDFGVEMGGKRKELMLDEFPSKYRALDVGRKTIELYSKEIKKARCIFVKGPMGHYEDEGFAKGTREILKAVASSRGFSVIGGGHTESALKEMGISKKKFNYVSLSGGALVKYIAGEKLVGLEALEKRGRK